MNEWIGMVVAAVIFYAPVILLVWYFTKKHYSNKVTGFNSLSEAIDAYKKIVADLNNEIINLTNDKDAIHESLVNGKINLSELEKEIRLKKAELQTIEGRTTELVELEKSASEIRDTLANGMSRYEAKLAEIERKHNEIEALDAELSILKGELDLYSRIDDFVDFGIYEEPEYIHDTSDRYQAEISAVREAQKTLISDKKAIHLPDGIEVNGTTKNGNAVLNGQAKLMLKSFNIECDNLIGKVSPSNFQRTLERIDKPADNLEKSAISLRCGISTEYVKLKFEECKLFYEFKLKKATEQEEQRLIREQIREEQRVIQEYDRAVKEAEKEERMYQQLLEKAREELSNAHEDEKGEFMAKIELLEQQLKEAEEKEQRAKSMAEQTRRGHVYVISNIGSFGEDVYKIGLTRRLDPMDRVRELGDASVPFQFDVHAVIYSDDAPAMETALHRRFNHRRVNAVNLRKEFFRVTLPEIKAVVDDIKDEEVDFRMTALAEEYYESLRLQGAESTAA